MFINKYSYSHFFKIAANILTNSKVSFSNIISYPIKSSLFYIINFNQHILSLPSFLQILILYLKSFLVAVSLASL